MGGRTMTARPSMWGELPPHGTILTTSEYLQTAESVRVQELIYGELRVEDSPHFRHQHLLLEMAMLLCHYVKLHRLGTVCMAPQDVILDPARALIVQPDLMFISNSRSHIISDHIWGAPDLVIEIMSPHPRIGKVEERIGYFEQYGVKECWLVHQLSREVEVLTFGTQPSRHLFKGVETIESSVFPDLNVAPAVFGCW